MPGIFRPVKAAEGWLVDGGLVNPVPVSLCRALGADFTIAVNLNEDLLGRRFLAEPLVEQSRKPPRGANWLDQIPTIPEAVASRLSAIRLFGNRGTVPGYFDVLGNAFNIMQDHITRSRLAGEPPHALILPRVIGIRLMDFHRVREAIAEGRAATERALPAIEDKLAALARITMASSDHAGSSPQRAMRYKE